MKTKLYYSLAIWLTLALLLGLSSHQYRQSNRDSQREYTAAAHALDVQYAQLIQQKTALEAQISTDRQKIIEYGALINDIDAYNRQLSASIFSNKRRLNSLMHRQQI